MGTNVKSAILSLVMCLAMVFAMMPAAAFAEAEEQKLWVGGIQVTSETLSGDGWSYDDTSGVLTLDGATINGVRTDSVGSSYSIYSDGIDLTIHLKGASSVGSKDTAKTTGIYVKNGSLRLEGDGTVDIAASRYGIFASGPLALNGTSVTMDCDDDGIHHEKKHETDALEINGGTAVIRSANGIGIRSSDVSISGGSSVTVTESRHGMSADSVSITDSKVDISSAGDEGIYSNKDVIIADSEVTVKTTGESAVNIYGGVVSVTDSSLIAESSELALEAAGISVQDGNGSKTTYVEAINNDDEPAVFAGAERGITIGEGLEIAMPEGGSIGYYKPDDPGYGYTVLDASGNRASHVVIQGQQKTEPEPVISKAPLMASLTASGKKTLELRWNKISGVQGYDIVFSRCSAGKDKDVTRKVATLKGSSKVEWKKSGLKAKKAYKACVKAWVMKNGKKTYVRISPVVHAYTSGGSGKYTNPKSVKVTKTKISLKKGKTYKIKASVTKLQKTRKLIPSSHAAAIRYKSSNTSVAKVSKSGKITAVSKGSCYVYVFAVNGVKKKIRVTVN